MPKQLPKKCNGVVSGWKGKCCYRTHTHVQTSDERILSKGTAYITDVGMTGPYDSVIGLSKDVAIKRFLNQIPVRYQIADSEARFCGVIISIDVQSGRANSIERISYAS